MGIRAPNEEKQSADNAMCLRVKVFAARRTESEVTKAIAARVLVLTKINNNYNKGNPVHRSLPANNNSHNIFEQSLSNRESISSPPVSIVQGARSQEAKARLRQTIAREILLLPESVRHRARISRVMANLNVNNPLPDLVPVMVGPVNENAAAVEIGANLRRIAINIDQVHLENQVQEVPPFLNWIAAMAAFIEELIFPLGVHLF